MADETPEKISRNEKLVNLREELSFRQLGKIFNISGARAKQIYDKEIKKRKGLDKGAGSRDNGVKGSDSKKGRARRK